MISVDPDHRMQVSTPSERLLVVRDILGELIQQFPLPFTLAVCGSTALGESRPASDLELIIVVENSDIAALFSTKLIKEQFRSRATHQVLEMTRTGDIDAIKLADTTYAELDLSVNVYTLRLCRRIAALSQCPATKFRETEKNEHVVYRGFAHAAGARGVNRPIQSQRFEGGALTVSDIVCFDRYEPYFFIYVDKFYSAFLPWDMLNIRSLQQELGGRLANLAGTAGREDAHGFLYNRAAATPGQLARLSSRMANARLEGLVDAHQASLHMISGPTGVGVAAQSD